MAFMHAGGYVLEKELQPGELLKIDTGCIVAFTETVDYDIQFIGGIQNRCLAEKVCFSRPCPDQGKFGSNPFRLAGWQDVFYNTQLFNGKKRVVYLAVLEICSMATDGNYYFFISCMICFCIVSAATTDFKRIGIKNSEYFCPALVL